MIAFRSIVMDWLSAHALSQRVAVLPSIALLAG
jgi:hypothetical protein